MTIETKFNIGDKVKFKRKKIEYEEYEDGTYRYQETKYVWSAPYEVIGAAIRKNPIKQKNETVICITAFLYDSHSVTCFREDELFFVDEVEENENHQE